MPPPKICSSVTQTNGEIEKSELAKKVLPLKVGFKSFPDTRELYVMKRGMSLEVNGNTVNLGVLGLLRLLFLCFSLDDRRYEGILFSDDNGVSLKKIKNDNPVKFSSAAIFMTRNGKKSKIIETIEKLFDQILTNHHKEIEKIWESSKQPVRGFIREEIFKKGKNEKYPAIGGESLLKIHHVEFETELSVLEKLRQLRITDKNNDKSLLCASFRGDEFYEGLKPFAKEV